MPDPNEISSVDVDETNSFAFDTSKIGIPEFLNGRLEWTPPPDLDVAQIELIKEALRHFNAGLERGDHKVERTPEGNFKVTPKGRDRASASSHWWGFKVNLNHAEACGWTAGISSVSDIAMGLAIAGPWALAAAAVIIASSSYIRSLNVLSGGKGVTLKFAWPAVYIGCSRRGKGKSPC